jgi:2-polyprenyl-3-methyl-5-hydroxy-6-metoxy-1,4-benzoquinol methylase
MRSFHPSVHEHVACSVCGAAEDYDVVYEAQHEAETEANLIEKYRASGDELLIDRLVQCRCGFKYVNPRLRGDLILSAYSEGEDPAYLSQLKARERTFAASLDQIEKAAGGKGRLLDIGTAAGAFVAAACARGWDAEGCEPNAWMAQWGAKHYGIRIRQGDVLAQSYEEGSFDVITLWDVIEHTPDPVAVLERCRQLLRPGGVLVVNYPDIGSWVARLMGRRWLFLTSVHLYYFDRQTIRRVLEKAGYSLETVRPHVQRLELDYILFRSSAVSRTVSSVGRGLARLLRIGGVEVPYWFGQTFVIARRASAWALVAGDWCSSLPL